MNKNTWAIAVVAALFMAFGAPAHAAMEIRRINFNPDGRDSGANSHLNREYIYLVNAGSRPLQLRGWRISDRSRAHVYRFGALYLQPGDTIHLRTGRGSDGAPVCEVGQPCPDNAQYDLYWGLSRYVWDNGGDRATLVDDSGNLVDRCRYGSATPNPKRC